MFDNQNDRDNIEDTNQLNLFRLSRWFMKCLRCTKFAIN